MNNSMNKEKQEIYAPHLMEALKKQ